MFVGCEWAQRQHKWHMLRVQALRTSQSGPLLNASGTARLPETASSAASGLCNGVQESATRFSEDCQRQNLFRLCRYGTTSCLPGTTLSAATQKPAQGCATAAQPEKSIHPTGVEQVCIHVPLRKHVMVCKCQYHANARAAGRVNREAVLAAHAGAPKRKQSVWH